MEMNGLIGGAEEAEIESVEILRKEQSLCVANLDVFVFEFIDNRGIGFHWYITIDKKQLKVKALDGVVLKNIDKINEEIKNKRLMILTNAF